MKIFFGACFSLLDENPDMKVLFEGKTDKEHFEVGETAFPRATKIFCCEAGKYLAPQLHTHACPRF